MRNLMKEVMSLQKEWNSLNTPAMEQRGNMIRRDIPQWLNENCGGWINDSGLTIEGRDGIGRKSQVPWVRLFSKKFSPTAKDNWYCVYLFHRDGHGCYLCLAHGVSVWENGFIVPQRSNDELEKLVDWARIAVEDEFLANVQGRGFDKNQIVLGSNTDFALAYERCVAFSKWYPAENLPDNLIIQQDLESFSLLLNRLYQLESSERGFDPVGSQREQFQRNILVACRIRNCGCTSVSGQEYH